MHVLLEQPVSHIVLLVHMFLLVHTFCLHARLVHRFVSFIVRMCSKHVRLMNFPPLNPAICFHLLARKSVCGRLNHTCNSHLAPADATLVDNLCT